MGIDDIIFDPSYDTTDCVVVTYWLTARTNSRDAATALALGQSIGNPTMRSGYETPELFEKYAARVVELLEGPRKALVKIAWPRATIDPQRDGISQLLCVIAGGQVDIDEIRECRIIDIKLPPSSLKPAFGLTGMQEFCGVYDRPLLGAIIKPKIGLSMDDFGDILKKLVDGGVNFIKDDEIWGTKDLWRIDRAASILEDANVLYAACINYDTVEGDFELPSQIGAHINVWSGLGAYRTFRVDNPDTFIHFQKSGDRFFTDPRAPYSISWPVICKLATWSGVDSMHVGMLGGYYGETGSVLEAVNICQSANVIPALSCGMTPEAVAPIRDQIGNDWMANVGGYIMGHRDGITVGALAMRKAIDS